MRFLSSPPGVSYRKFAVAVKPLKLELGGLNDVVFGCEGVESGRVGLELKWKGNCGLLPFRRALKKQSNFSPKRVISRRIREPIFIEWADVAFESNCTFCYSTHTNSFAPWGISFKILLAKGEEFSKEKLSVLGKASLDIAELASKMQPLAETKLPFTLKSSGLCGEASLLMSVAFAEIRNSQDVFGVVQNVAELHAQTIPINAAECTKGDRFKFGNIFRRKSNVAETNKADERFSGDMDTSSATSEASGSPHRDTVGSIRLDGIGSKSISGSETRFDSVVLSWKRKRSSPRWMRKQGKPLIKKTHGLDDDDGRVKDAAANASGPSGPDDPAANPTSMGNWEMKEMVSRDGQAKLRAGVFFASFDQRSEQAAGEGACTALVAVIAHWLQSNPSQLPTRSELDRLITEGSSHWQSLCCDETYANDFPNNHFDLETILLAELNPLAVLPDKSFVGFFSPEKFKSLKGFMSFDEIWNAMIGPYAGDHDEPKVYIVSWNDHFFVLKVEKDACYLIDTLGERLFEGCSQAFVLKFDKTASMEREGEVICSGKECCKEFMKRFLAALPLSELEVQEEKGSVSSLLLHQRLQIEFHFCSLSSSCL